MASAVCEMRWFRTLTAQLDSMPRVKKAVVAVIGTTVLIFGFVLIVLPGPAVIVIPLGLAILASEFAWARRVIRRGKLFVGRIRKRGIVRIVQRQDSAG
jgi:tellurite resistance protein TerC